MRRVRRFAGVAAFVVAGAFALVALPRPPPAFGAAACSYDSLNDQVIVSIPLDLDSGILREDGSTGQIQMNSGTCVEPGTGAVATTKNTVSVLVNGSAGNQSITIDLSGGYFGGIDFAITLGGQPGDSTFIFGSAFPDFMTVGSSGFELGPPSNPGGSTGTLSGVAALVLSGGGGDDRLSAGGGGITMTGGPYPGTANLGGDGDEDTLIGGSGPNVLSGGPGRDVVSYLGRTENLNITANDTADDGVPGELDNVSSDTEVLAGGSGNDTIAGGVTTTPDVGQGFSHCQGDPNVGGRELCGNGGDDTFLGPLDSNFFGGSGAADTFDFGGSFFPLSISLDNVSNDGITGGDEFGNVHDDVENVIGGSESDHITGSAAANFIDGGPGSDTIDGGGGTDELIGGTGVDSASYGSHAVGVTITLNGLADDGAPGENDFIHDDFEWASGGSAGDLITGDDGANHLNGAGGIDVLNGGDGNDRLFGGAGENTLNGGGGIDTLDGGAETDILNGGGGIDTLNGDVGDDTLNGGSSGDVLNGGDGDDTLNGGDGNDDLDGGLGADVIAGNDGPRDALHYDDRTARVVVTLGGGANDGEAGEDDRVISSVEWVYGGSGNDEFKSSSRGIIAAVVVDNAFVGGEGEDTLLGGGGDDILNGGNGDDTLKGGLSADILRGQANEDTLEGEGGNDWLRGGSEVDLMKGNNGDDLFQAVDDTADDCRGGQGQDRGYFDPQDDLRSIEQQL